MGSRYVKMFLSDLKERFKFTKIKKESICIIGIVGIPASYGGFETLVENLVEDSSIEYCVYCSSLHYPQHPAYYKSAKLIYLPLSANGKSSIVYDILSMLHALISGHKNFLVLGISGAIFLPILSCFPRVTIITNIDGIEWQRKKWKMLAKIFLRFSEFLAVKFSTQIVSDNDAITNYIAQKYKSSCKTIAYGGDHAFRPMAKSKLDESFNVVHPFALSICRIEPENNIHLILEAFAKINLPIIFIGNWETSGYGKALYNKYKGNINITLLQPIYCLDSLHAFRASCSVYVHGHSAGGTNPSLVEMMHFSKPIIAFDCSFNRATMENEGSYFNSSRHLAEILDDPISQTDGEVMTEIAKRRYTWEIIREQYLILFTK
jgi:glycosyltransferase involved in cell wall biosynthesis